MIIANIHHFERTTLDSMTDKSNRLYWKTLCKSISHRLNPFKIRSAFATFRTFCAAVRLSNRDRIAIAGTSNCKKCFPGCERKGFSHCARKARVTYVRITFPSFVRGERTSLGGFIAWVEREFTVTCLVRTPQHALQRLIYSAKSRCASWTNTMLTK